MLGLCRGQPGLTIDLQGLKGLLHTKRMPILGMMSHQLLLRTECWKTVRSHIVAYSLYGASKFGYGKENPPTSWKSEIAFPAASITGKRVMSASK